MKARKDTRKPSKAQQILKLEAKITDLQNKIADNSILLGQFASALWPELRQRVEQIVAEAIDGLSISSY